MSDKDPLSQAEFNDIYSKVPRLTVEILIINKLDKVYLTQRSIEPCIGQWHLPGGTVRFGESLLEAVKRIASRELGISVLRASNVGYIEYPSHYLHNLDSPVGIVFRLDEYDGTMALNLEASDGNWFSVIPRKMHADQDTFLIANGFLQRE